MPFEYFTSEQIIPLIISGTILIASVIIFNKKSNLSLLLLFLGALGMGYFMANLDHFLILWDEQYHALVAKNLVKHPLLPTLYDNPIIDYDYRNWTANHIWLHKQPLFLWQMALSIKLFGTTELAVRIPSIVLHSVIPLFIYRIGKIAINKNAAYIGALLFAVAYFPLELVVGRYSTDHNDVAFLFYITASFWAWFEYKQSNKKYWIIIIGVFSGCAVLVKWLMGLLVYIVWIITILIADSGERFRIKSYLPVIYSGLTSIAVIIPWQLYIMFAFPKESLYEFALNSKHFFNPIEEHSENVWYYFTDGLKLLYGSGDAMPWIMLLAVIILIVKASRKTYKVFLASSIIFVYLFYTIAATKMVSFTLIVFPLMYLGLGTLISQVILFIDKQINRRIVTRISFIIIIIVVGFISLNLNKIQNYHTMWKPHDNHKRIDELVEMNFINSLEELLGNEDYVIFNAEITVNGHIPIMFYTDYIAYNFFPDKEQITQIKEADTKIAVVDLGNLPDYIKSDQDIKILKVEDMHLLTGRSQQP